MEKGKKIGISLFYRLLAAFLGVVIVASVMLTVTFYLFEKEHLEKDAEEHISQSFITLENYFRYKFAENIIKDLKVLAYNPVLNEFIMSSGSTKEINARLLEKLFSETLTYTKSYQRISFVDNAGKENVVVDRRCSIRKYNDLSSTKLFTLLKSEDLGSIHIEGPYMDKNGKASFSIGIYKDFEDIGTFGGAVIIDYSLEEFFGYSNRMKIFDENPIWIFSPDGKILKKPSHEEAIFDPRLYLSDKIQKAPVLRVLKKGIVVYQDLSIIPNKPLIRLAISMPAQLLLKDIRSVLPFFSIVFILSIITTSMVAFSLSRYLSRPIIELAQAADRLAKGDLSSQIKIKATGEIQILAESFNQMIQDLQQTMVSLKSSAAELENSNKELEAFAYINSHDPYGIFLIGMDKKILSANKTALELAGYESEEQLVGKICHHTLCPAQGDECPIIDLNQQVDKSEKILITKDGRRVPILKSVVPIKIDDRDILLECVIDITERKLAEEELKSFAAKLEKSNKELEAFAYIASHDLQEPLRKVMAFGERLKAKWGESLPDQGRDYLERMQHATLRMQALINDLLAFSRVTSKAKPFVPVDLNAAVREVLSDLEVKIEQLKGHVDIGNLPVIEADPLQMRQLFQNLIGNALKFHKREESPAVTVKSEKVNGTGEIHPELYQITVEDNGIGFDEKYVDRIFGVFQRLHGCNEYEGTGIGLSICNKIVERHNGNITAKSAPGEGSSFIITLPAKQIKGENNV